MKSWSKVWANNCLCEIESKESNWIYTLRCICALNQFRIVAAAAFHNRISRLQNTSAHTWCAHTIEQTASAREKIANNERADRDFLTAFEPKIGEALCLGCKHLRHQFEKVHNRI
jgi:hypothetical protein